MSSAAYQRWAERLSWAERRCVSRLSPNLSNTGAATEAEDEFTPETHLAETCPSETFRRAVTHVSSGHRPSTGHGIQIEHFTGYEYPEPLAFLKRRVQVRPKRRKRDASTLSCSEISPGYSVPCPPRCEWGEYVSVTLRDGGADRGGASGPAGSDVKKGYRAPGVDGAAVEPQHPVPVLRSPGLSNPARPADAFRNLPVVDVSALFGAEPAALARLVGELRRAAHEVGFLYVTGHGVSPSRILDLERAAERFFALPESDKLELYIGGSRNHRGYVPPGEEVFYG